MASGSGDARSLRVESYVRGYHVYQRIWNPFVGEVAVAVREEGNVHDRYAVAILESDTCSLSPSSSITTTTFRDLPGPRLGFSWVALLKESSGLAAARLHARDFASASHSYLLLEIFHTGTNEGMILIMRQIE